MASLLHRRSLFGAAVLLVVSVSGPAVHAAPLPAKKLTTIGFVYGGTISHGIDTYAMKSDHTLRFVRETPSPSGSIGGLAVLHTKGGTHLYVLAGPFGGIDVIYNYNVHPKTGAISFSGTKPTVGVLGILVGNNLFAYDGYAKNHKFASTIYVEKCINPTCTTYGLGNFRASSKTGVLKLRSTPHPHQTLSISVYGDRMDTDTKVGKTNGTEITPIRLAHSTGAFHTGSPRQIKTDDNPPNPGYAGLVATMPKDVGIGNLSVGSGTQVAVFPDNGKHIRGADGIPEVGEGSTMSYVPHWLVVGESGNSYGPQLQLVSPSAHSASVFDLTKKPFDEPVGSSLVANFVETIFTLGGGVYVGTYAGLMVQGTDIKGSFKLNHKHPTVPNSSDTEALTGYLIR